MNGFQIYVLRMLAWLVQYQVQTHRSGSVPAAFLIKGSQVAEEASRDCDQSEGVHVENNLADFKVELREIQERLRVMTACCTDLESAALDEAVDNIDRALQFTT